MKNIFKDKSGETLIETLIAVLLCTFSVIVMMSFMRSTDTMGNMSKTKDYSSTGYYAAFDAAERYNAGVDPAAAPTVNPNGQVTLKYKVEVDPTNGNIKTDGFPLANQDVLFSGLKDGGIVSYRMKD